MATIETDVLIVGAGPAGASLGCFLTHYGVTGLIISKASSTARTPRAHVTNCATFECLRDVGLEKECRKLATPKDLLTFYRFCTTMAGEELSRSYYGGTDPNREGEYKLKSPCAQADLPQSILEPILLRIATHGGFKLRWDYEFLGFSPDKDPDTSKIYSTVKDLISGQSLTIISNYLCGADGARSVVARELQLPFDDQPFSGLAINVFFEAELTHLLAHSPSLIHMLLKPDKPQPDYCAIAIARQVQPFDQWVFSLLAKPGVTEVTASPDEIMDHVRDLIGDDSVEVKLHHISTWTINECYAKEYSRGNNIFCLGDAVHRHPPFQGLGSNTCIQDAYNLAWKIGYVEQGLAGPSLLESYVAERQPVGRAVVKRTNETGRIHKKLFSLLGVFEPDVNEKLKILSRFKEEGQTGAAARDALQAIIEELDSERQGLGIEMNQLYQSEAIWSADEQGEAPELPLPEADLHYLESTYPGFRLPHAWLQASTAAPGEPMISTHDLAGKGRFTLFTGIGGKTGWKYATERVRQDLKIDMEVYSIGDDYRDLFFQWKKKRGVMEKGAVLVRPDRFVAWRSNDITEFAAEKLVTVMARILGHVRITLS
ncbi:FAD binding domain-containing protein [Nemania sp. FL0916]|nr:FAD binding domain-containing protein [Nemania sp. FL0916]